MSKHLATLAFASCASVVLFGAVALAQSPTPQGTPTAPGNSASEPALVPTVPVPGSVYQPGGGPFAFANVLDPQRGRGVFEQLWITSDAAVN